MLEIVGATQGLVRSNSTPNVSSPSDTDFSSPSDTDSALRRSNSMPDFGKVASDIQEDYLNAPIISIITPISPIIIPKDPQK